MMKKLIAIVFPALAAVLLIVGCEKKVEVPRYGIITGTVYDDSTNAPLVNVRISTVPASNVVLTDSNGTFTVDGVKEGETSVKAERTGYKAGTVSVNVVKEDTANVYFQLTHTESGTGGNKYPLANPLPEDEAQNIGVDTSLSWTFSSNAKDVTFDVFLYATNSAVQHKVATDITDTTISVTGSLKYATTYFWYVVAKQDNEQLSISEVWTFTTSDLPDNKLVFAREVSNNFEIFSSGLQGENEVQITTNTARDHNPSLNLILDRISFTSNRGTDYQLYHTRRDGSDLTPVTNLAVTGYHNNGIGYCWAPNGNGFLYSHYDKLYYINKDGAGLTAIKDTAPAGRNWREVDWNGSTRKIVAQAVGVNIYDSEIYLMDQDGTNVQLLLPNDPGRTDHPVFSADGTKILFTRDAQGFNSADGRQLDARIYLMDLNTMTTTDLSVDKVAGTNDLMPEFSPNNARVIFVNEDNTGTGIPEVWQMDIDGKNRKLLIENAGMPYAK